MQKIKDFIRRHPVAMHFILAIIAGLIIIWLIVSVFLKSWTHHNDTVTVPPVKGLSINVAAQSLKNGGFKVVVDSIYDENSRPGCVVDQIPRENALVKKGREVYLTYACFSPKLIKVPQYYNMSRRQAVTAFEEVGLRSVSVREVPSEHADLVITAKYNGVELRPGQQIPVGASVVIEVGAGLPEEIDDSQLSTDDGISPEDIDAHFVKQLQSDLDL